MPRWFSLVWLVYLLLRNKFYQEHLKMKKKMSSFLKIECIWNVTYAQCSKYVKKKSNSVEILEYFPNLHIPSWAWNHSVDEPISNGGQVYGTDENFPNLIIFPVDGVSEKQKIIIIIIIFHPNHDLNISQQCGQTKHLLSLAKYFVKTAYI